MNLINGDGSKMVAGCRAGETVWLTLITGKSEKVVLVDITRLGIEGFEGNLKDQPLTFYPYSSILKVRKYVEL